MEISHEQARALIDLAAVGLISLAVVGVLVRRLESAVWLLALQGVMLGLAAGATALAEGHWEAWAAFGVALTIKAAFIPAILLRVLQRITVRREVELVLSIKLALPVAFGLVLVAYRVALPFRTDDLDGFLTPNAIPAALALLLLGLFTMVTRKKALSQVIGLVTMENGLYLGSIAATRGLPLAAEMGVAMDVLTGVALMALIIHEINVQFTTINTDRLRSLRD